jgi:hypothetical protein
MKKHKNRNDVQSKIGRIHNKSKLHKEANSKKGRTSSVAAHSGDKKKGY